MNVNIKPDWKNAPSWAAWLAQDGYGAWGWYEKKPIALDDDYGCWDIVYSVDQWTRPGNTDWDEPFTNNTFWADTLEPRPGQ